MCELHLFTLYIYDQNTTIQMFVVVFWSFILLCVVLQLYGAIMCVNACICTVSSMHAFLAVYDQAFPCPIYTQSRAYWVWARYTNDGKHSQLKRGSVLWHLSYRLRSLTTRTPSSKCLMHMLTLPFSESTQVFKWNFANTVTVCHILKWQLSPSYLVLFYFSVFTIKCFIYGIMLSHLKAYFTKLFKTKTTKFNLVCWKQDIFRCIVLGWLLDRDQKPSLLTTKRQLTHLIVLLSPLWHQLEWRIFKAFYCN